MLQLCCFIFCGTDDYFEDQMVSFSLRYSHIQWRHPSRIVNKYAQNGLICFSLMHVCAAKKPGSWLLFFFLDVGAWTERDFREKRWNLLNSPPYRSYCGCFYLCLYVYLPGAPATTRISNPSLRQCHTGGPPSWRREDQKTNCNTWLS